MADTYTASNRFEKMEPGAYADTWATRANGQFGSDLMDQALDGRELLTVSGTVTLTTANGAADQARKRLLLCTGTGGTIIVPNVPKWYIVKNSGSGDITVTTNLGGANTVVKSNMIVFAFCDGSTNCYQMIRADFDAQNIVTSGNVSCAALETTGAVTLGDSTSADQHVVNGRLTLSAADATNHRVIHATGGTSFSENTFLMTDASYQGIAAASRVNRSANSVYGFFVGVSSSSGTPDTEFYVRGDGLVLSDGGTAMTTPADYADMMEWLDGNPESEDRIGYSVVVEDGKVRKATSEDDPVDIVGIGSGNPSVCGGSGWNRWVGKWLTDDFNRQILTEDGERILNPTFDPGHEYVPRSERNEWDPIGLVGRLPMRKGCPVNPRWVKLRDISPAVEEWLVR
jgi:hypothetical protein